MSRVKAYDPQQGYMYQILVWYEAERMYEHLDYAVDRADLKHLMTEYRMIYKGGRFKIETLPRRYWKEKGGTSNEGKVD